MFGYCRDCGEYSEICAEHRCCPVCCPSEAPNHWGLYDADELGLDPETDNTPGDPTRHA